MLNPDGTRHDCTGMAGIMAVALVGAVVLGSGVVACGMLWGIVRVFEAAGLI